MSGNQQPKISKMLSENMVLFKSNSKHLWEVKKLDLWGRGIDDVSLVKDMPNLEVVSLTANKLSTLESFRHCPNLRELYLRGNKIGELEEIVHLEGLSRLEKLWLAENPCASSHNYRPTVLRTLPNIKILDNIPVSDSEKAEAKQLGGALSNDHMHGNKDSEEKPTFRPKKFNRQLSSSSPNLDIADYSEENNKELFKKVAPKNLDEDTAKCEEMNQLRAKYGLKPLPLSSSVDPSVKIPQMQTRNTHDKDIRQAVFYLTKTLDKESLLIIGEMIATRLRTEFNDFTFSGGDSAQKD